MNKDISKALNSYRSSVEQENRAMYGLLLNIRNAYRSRRHPGIVKISEATGIATSTISRTINGKLVPNPTIVVRLAEYFANES